MLKITKLPEFSKPLGHDNAPEELDFLESVFENAFNDMATQVHMTTREKGFWENAEHRNQPEMIALMHSELSEALEALRKDPYVPDSKVPARTNLECELADTIIRIMDFAKAYDLKVAEAICEKARYNQSRAYKHGKKF